MTDVLQTNLGLVEKESPEATAVPQTPGVQAEGNEKLKEAEKGPDTSPEGEVMSFASMEPSTLQWPAGKDALNKAGRPLSQESQRVGGEGKEMDGERASMQSDCLSLRGAESTTESERELRMREKMKSEDGWLEKEKEKEKEREVELELRARPKGSHMEIEMDEVNSMPEEAARVFRPNMHHSSIVPDSPRDWDDEDRRPFLGSHGAPVNGYYHDWEQQETPPKSGCAGSGRDLLKAGISLFAGAVIFPFLIWGGYVFLPFDAPYLETAPLRLVYTLRCSVFGVVPIVLGLLVLGISRIRFGALRPQFETEVKEVAVHRRFVDESVSLFVLYFVQLAVLAAYLNHDLLKLVPLLTIVFAIGRLCYWVAATMGSSLRGFGFALSFLPMMTMLVANMYFIFVLDAEGNLFAQEARSSHDSPSTYRQRFWG
ncbi:transmembrane protein 79 [Sardina pilchardus]|uniref:transmembrane protein 79 n=1 Tax=Sardina pilchardus TaxID=27697 RepID=UPI002E159845